ncbi:sulfotransferase domain-containing protein [Altererythrobacter sp. GH1-8]|uniref:sulfotransferase domain-containing protein n=1 Tax=Altererythrobacter sp. GH1-8 TaxID=3349333 RepID=UPI00374D97BA
MAGRARSIEEFAENMEAMAAKPSPDYRPYEPQVGDVFITPWAKSGTTLMQQMFHQLRTGGDMDFDDISRVVPWDDTGTMIGLDLNAPQKADPRGFKSHREYERLPAGMRYVVTLRDPKECFVSFYRFFNGWHIERDAIPMEEFMPFFMGGGPGGCDYFTHLLSWYARHNEPDTLLTTYHWAVKNKRAVIARLAQFIGTDLTQDLADLVDHRTTRAFMVEHMDKFDDKLVAEALERNIGIPAASDSTKVQAEGSDAKTIPAGIAQQIDSLWADRVLPVTGHSNFAALAAELDG